MTVTWISTGDVGGALGIAPAAQTDDDWLVRVTAAANAWAFRARAAAGYTDDEALAPGEDAALGTTLYGVALYRERGALDGYPSFVEIDAGPPAAMLGSMGQIRRLLGIGRPATDGPLCELAPVATPVAETVPAPPYFGPYPQGWVRG